MVQTLDNPKFVPKPLIIKTRVLNLVSILNEIELYLEISIMGCALLILAMTLIAYWLAKSSKLLIISGAFILFFIRGLCLFLGNFFETFNDIPANSYWLTFDFIILLLIYFAITKK